MTSTRAFWLVVAVVVGSVAALLHLWWTCAGMVFAVASVLTAVRRSRRADTAARAEALPGA